MPVPAKSTSSSSWQAADSLPLVTAAVEETDDDATFTEADIEREPGAKGAAQQPVRQPVRQPEEAEAVSRYAWPSLAASLLFKAAADAVRGECGVGVELPSCSCSAALLLGSELL